MSDQVTDRIGPVPADERITVIDCLRGAALFGIIVSNMRGFGAPFLAYFQPHLMWTWLPDRITQALLDWLVTGKFITLFAALFGVGFAIQMERAAASHRGIAFYARRMAVLLVIGLLHSFLLWWGDILTSYAICGFLLMLFRKRSQRTVLWWGHIMYWLLPAMFWGFYVASRFGVNVPGLPETTAEDLQKTVQVYAHGSFAEIFSTRAGEWMSANAFVIILTHILGIFLFGLYLWRQGYLRYPVEHMDWWRNAQRIGLPIGLAGNGLAVVIEAMFHPNPMKPSLMMAGLFTLQSFAMPALSLFYAATVVLLWQDPVWQKRLQPFSFVGRMALTNYLLQSVVCTTIFYSYGLGLYGRVGPFYCLWLAVLIYGLQIPFSQWWLSGHRYGPMEWVWRRLTYGRLIS
jgi:uncharacterized protein